MADYTGNDIYCDLIIPRKIDIQIVEETRHILAYYHTRPFWPVHIVVTPKSHVASLVELPPGATEANIELWKLVRNIAKKLQDEEGGCHIITNLGQYQDSKHFHIHLGAGAAVKANYEEL